MSIRGFMVFSILFGMVLAGCNALGMTNLAVLKAVPPHSRDVEIVMGGAPAPTTPVIFTADYRVRGNWTELRNLSPTQEMIADIKRISAQHGADIVVVKCGAPGTVGQGWCTLAGHAR